MGILDIIYIFKSYCSEFTLKLVKVIVLNISDVFLKAELSTGYTED